MLKIENLQVNYGGIQALRGISLEVPDGKVVTLIGANGAGKSTTLRTITGLVKAGQNIFAAGFITKIGSNLIDKVGTCLVAYFLLKAMPARFLSMFKGE